MLGRGMLGRGMLGRGMLGQGMLGRAPAKVQLHRTTHRAPHHAHLASGSPQQRHVLQEGRLGGAQQRLQLRRVSQRQHQQQVRDVQQVVVVGERQLRRLQHLRADGRAAWGGCQHLAGVWNCAS